MALTVAGVASSCAGASPSVMPPMVERSTRDAELQSCLTAALEAELPESPSSLSAERDREELEFLPHRMHSPYAAALGPCVSARLRAWRVPPGPEYPREAVLMHLRPEGSPAPAFPGCTTLAEARVDGQHLTVLNGARTFKSSSPFFAPEAEDALQELLGERRLSFIAQVTAEGVLKDVEWLGDADAVRIARAGFLPRSLRPNEACGVPIDSKLQLQFAYGRRRR